jgi:hypothetical protein
LDRSYNTKLGKRNLSPLPHGESVLSFCVPGANKGLAPALAPWPYQNIMLRLLYHNVISVLVNHRALFKIYLYILLPQAVNILIHTNSPPQTLPLPLDPYFTRTPAFPNRPGNN